MEEFKEVVAAMPWYGWIALVAVLGGTVISLVTASQRHQERMEKIKKGIDPDAGGP